MNETTTTAAADRASIRRELTDTQAAYTELVGQIGDAHWNQRSGIPFQLRSTAEFSRFFTGLDLVAPGVTSVMTWRPETWRPHPRPEAVSMLGAVARIP